ncbi:MAG: hypoxanthine phosphoribosyltransferase, partial [Lactococcus sp.]
MLEKDIKKVLISEEEIQSKTIELGKILADEYKDKNPLLLGILRGS